MVRNVHLVGVLSEAVSAHEALHGRFPQPEALFAMAVAFDQRLDLLLLAHLGSAHQSSQRVLAQLRAFGRFLSDLLGLSRPPIFLRRELVRVRARKAGEGGRYVRLALLVWLAAELGTEKRKGGEGVVGCCGHKAAVRHILIVEPVLDVRFE